MKNERKFFVLFLIYAVLNFGALGVGSYLMGEGPAGEWYTSLAIAPWTPPGWVFGAAWSTIMILFSVYVARIHFQTSRKGLFYTIYGVQWGLNVTWNLVFFNLQMPGSALFIIVCLFLLLILMAMHFSFTVKKYTWLIMPYILWLVVAISLNAYIAIFNG